MSFSSTNRTDPRLIPVSETEQTQRLTNEEFDGLRSTLRKSLLISSSALISVFLSMML